MENSLINESEALEAANDKQKVPAIISDIKKKKNTMLAITIFFTLFTVATFSGIILWQAHFSKQEEKAKQPGEKNLHPDTIVIAR